METRRTVKRTQPPNRARSRASDRWTMRRLLACVVATLLFVIVDIRRPHALAAGSPSQRAQRRVALFIGVADYQVLTDVPNIAVNGGLTDLAGPEHDVQRMRASLLQWGFTDSTNIRVVLNAAATRDGIARSFRWLAERASDTSDVVLVYYSGHGTHVPDANREEADGEDEAIVPYDASDFSSAAQVVIDDSLGVWLRALPTRNVTFVVDACFSGSITRGERSGHAKGLPAARSEPPNDGRLLGTGELGQTVISASRSFETAQELEFPEGSNRYSGAMTYHLTRLLDGASATRGLRYDELMGALRQAVAGERLSQIPQIEGDSVSPLFRSRVGVTSRAFATVLKQRSNSVTLSVGAVHGVRVTATYDVYGSSEVRFAGDRVARVRVDTVADTVSQATIIAESGEVLAAPPTLSDGARAVLSSVPVGASEVRRLRLFVAPAARVALARLRGLDTSRIEMVSDSARAHAALTQARGALAIVVDGVPLPPAEGPSGAPRAASRGDVLAAYGDHYLCDGLTRALSIAKLAALTNPSAPSNLHAFIRVVPHGTRPPFDTTTLADTVRLGTIGTSRFADVYALVTVPDDAVRDTRLYVSAAVSGFLSAPFVFFPQARANRFPLNVWYQLWQRVPLRPPAGREVIALTVNSSQYDLSSLTASANVCASSPDTQTRGAGSASDAVLGWTSVSRVVHFLPAKQP